MTRRNTMGKRKGRDANARPHETCGINFYGRKGLNVGSLTDANP